MSAVRSTRACRTPLLLLILALAVFAAACGGGSADEDPTEAAVASTTPEATDAADAVTEEPTSSDQAAPVEDPNRQDAVSELVASGVSEESANCFVDTLSDAGITVEDAAAVGTGVTPEDPQAFAAANVEALGCLSEEERGSLGSAAAAEDPESIRQGFIQGLAASGVTEDQAACVYDAVIEDGFTPEDLASTGLNPSPELQASLEGAVTGCSAE